MRTFILILALALALTGCTGAEQSLYPPGHFASLIASEVALAAESRKPDAPQPQPGDTCPNCNGVGKVGDGVVMVTCAECDGSGKVKQSQEPEPPQPAPVVSQSTPVDCPDGSCPLPQQPAIQPVRQALRQAPISQPVYYQEPYLHYSQPVQTYSTIRRGVFGRRVQYCGPGGCQ